MEIRCKVCEWLGKYVELDMGLRCPLCGNTEIFEDLTKPPTPKLGGDGVKKRGSEIEK